jgi:hypothetical protein
VRGPSEVSGAFSLVLPQGYCPFGRGRGPQTVLPYGHTLSLGMEILQKLPRRGPGQLCINCSTRPADTNDHVPPRSWFPSSLPNLQRVKVPCCTPCDTTFAAAERAFVRFLAMGIGTEVPLFKEVAERVVRSFTPAAGAEKGNEAERIAQAEAIARRLVFVPWRPGAPVVHFRTPEGVLVPATLVMSIDGVGLIRVGGPLSKQVRVSNGAGAEAANETKFHR